jgi:hypothetical protein
MEPATSSTTTAGADSAAAATPVGLPRVEEREFETRWQIANLMFCLLPISSLASQSARS